MRSNSSKNSAVSSSSGAQQIYRKVCPRRHTIRRPEVAEGGTSLTVANELAIRRSLEAAGVEFIDENGGGPGVRLRRPVRGQSGK
jgi:hypothetical protein